VLSLLWQQACLNQNDQQFYQPFQHLLISPPIQYFDSEKCETKPSPTEKKEPGHAAIPLEQARHDSSQLPQASQWKGAGPCIERREKKTLGIGENMMTSNIGQRQ
jgi:hypothetical protein